MFGESQIFSKTVLKDCKCQITLHTKKFGGQFIHICKHCSQRWQAPNPLAYNKFNNSLIFSQPCVQKLQAPNHLCICLSNSHFRSSMIPMLPKGRVPLNNL